jgi:diguanylate cyclase (GGDEF)-like protein/PAS domain S-box-containing protein
MSDWAKDQGRCSEETAPPPQQSSEGIERDAESGSWLTGMNHSIDGLPGPDEENPDGVDEDDSTESLNLSALFTQDVTSSGSFDIRGEIWATTLGKVMQALPIPAFLLDRTFRVTVANQAWGRISPDYGTAIGCHFSSLFPVRSFADKARSLVEKVFKDRKPTVARMSLEIAKRRVWGRLTLRSIRVMQERFVLVLFEDLTHEKRQLLLKQEHNEALRNEIGRRKKAEERLTLERAHLLSLFDSINEIIYVTDPFSYEVLFVNEFGKEVLGEDSVGEACYEVFHDFSEPCDFCTNSIILEQRNKPYQWEYQEPRTQRHYLVTDRIIEWADGRDARFELAIDITKRKRAEKALQESELKYRTLFDESIDAVYVTSRDGKIVDANQAFLDTFGLTDTELPSVAVEETYANASDRLRFQRSIELMGSVKDYELKMRKKDGRIMDCLITATVRRSNAGEIFGYNGIIRDITERKRIEEAVIRAKKDWEQTFDTVPDMIAILDRDRRTTRVNKALADRLGIHPREAVGMHCWDWCFESGNPPENCPFDKMMADGKEHSVEMVESENGGHFLVTMTPLQDVHGEVIGCVHVAREITEQKRLEQWLRKLATHDSLTNLLNRRHLLESLESACETTRRYDVPLSLCLCDIDDFKTTNDRYGHQAGDRVLRKFGDILRQELRQSDFAGRYGGDEFMVVCPHTKGKPSVELMERICERLRQWSLGEGSEWGSVTCSVGVAEFFPERMTVDDLIRDADGALYEGKNLGRNRVVLKD